MVARIRLISSDDVLHGAEKVVADLIESYRQPVRDMSEIIYHVSHDAHGSKREFTQACRQERSVILRQL
jgi:hypothetical protein